MNSYFRQSAFGRRGIIVGCVAALSITLAACGSGGSSSGKTDQLKVMTWGGAFTEAERSAYYEPFTKATGIKVTEVSPVSLAKIKAAVINKTNDVDVSSVSVTDYFQAVKEGLLDPIDYSTVKRGSAPSDVYEEYGVKANSISYQLVYNPKKFPNGGPQSWADFWDVKNLPGDRALWNNPVGNIEFALLADGVAPGDLYPMTDAKVAQAFKKLDEIKPKIKVWWDQGAQSQQLFKDGEADLMMMWNGRASDLRAGGTPITQVWNGNGLAVNRWIVPKGTPNETAAMQFVNSSLQPERQAAFAKVLGYGPSDPKALSLLSKEEVDAQPSSPAHVQVGFEIDGKWWGENMSTMLPKWQTWLAK